MSFDPTSVTSATLKLWVKGDAGVYKDAGTTPCADGDKVQQWNDQSGNGNHLTQTATANQPTFTATGINSLGHLNFTATATNFFNVPDLGLSAAAAGEIFILIKDVADAPPTTDKTGIWTFTDEVSNNNCHYPWTDGIIYECWGARTRFTTVNPTPSLTAAHLYGVRSSTATWANALDGSDLLSSGGHTVNFKTTGILLGRSNLGGGNYNHDGPIAEVAVYNGVLSNLDRAQLNDYFGITRYALWSASAGRLTQLVPQVLTFPNPNARLTSLFTQILVPTTPPSSGKGQLGRW